MSTVNAAVDDPLIGTRIDGRYTVHGVLGAGGMGVVYEGVHDELGRQVAIKVLNAAWATDRTAVERFLREARTASSFSHGNIVDVSDLGRLADGRPFLVMPKITGVDLATLLHETGPQPAKRVAALLAGVAAALDLVHAKGYVHRDIKPENLMYVVREDGSETVMLLDFGIAAAVMSSGPRLTRQGSIFGTPHYLPPEVCAGQRSDARGDVYSLAAVAYELITGALPFPIEDIMQLMAIKVTQDAPSLAAASGQSFPPEVEAVIARGMARNPNERFPSASAFIHALRGATEYAPVSWQTGVLRSNMRSAEHVLPQQGSAHHPSHAPMTRAPTMPAQALHGFDETSHPSHPSYPRHPSQPGYGEERSHPSYPQRSREASYPQHPSQPQAREASYPQHPGQPFPAREGSYPQQPSFAQEPNYGSGPQYRTNEGVWGMHAAPAADGGRRDTRLRMSDERQFRTAQLPRRSSAGRYVLGTVALAALGFGAVELMGERGRSITDTRPSTAVEVPNRAVVPPASPPEHATVAPHSPSNVRPGTPPSTAARASNGVSATPSVAARQPTAPSTVPSGLPAAPGVDVAPSQAAPSLKPAEPAVQLPVDGAPAAAPADVRVAAAPSIPVAEPPRAEPAPVSKPSSPSASARPSSRVREPAIPDSMPEPPAPSPSSQVVTLTPQAPEPEPEPPAAPAVDTASATVLARESGSALLRGEVSRAVDLARRATQADASYAGGWRSLGLALERSGSTSEAVAAYSEYLQRAPTGPQADMVRQRMQALGH